MIIKSTKKRDSAFDCCYLTKIKMESFILQMNSTNQFSDSLNAPRNHTFIITEAAIIIRWKAFLHMTQLVQSNQGARIARPLTNHIQWPCATIYTTFVTRLASILFVRIFFWGTFGDAIRSVFDVFAGKALIRHLRKNEQLLQIKYEHQSRS